MASSKRLEGGNGQLPRRRAVASRSAHRQPGRGAPAVRRIRADRRRSASPRPLTQPAAATAQSPPIVRRKRIFITAAEASGDQHAAELVRSLKELDPSLEIEGLGGPKMAAAGAKLLEDTVGKAAMGWRGALRALEASRWMNLVSARYREAQPDLHICVDSSAINLPFAKQAKEKFGVPVLYYIAPQLWASREGRMKQMREYVDHVACIFPFEQEYFRSHGVKATFVGHPLFDQLPVDRVSRSETARVFPTPAGDRNHPRIAAGEVEANLPHLIDVMDGMRVSSRRSRFWFRRRPRRMSSSSKCSAGAPTSRSSRTGSTSWCRDAIW